MNILNFSWLSFDFDVHPPKIFLKECNTFKPQVFHCLLTDYSIDSIDKNEKYLPTTLKMEIGLIQLIIMGNSIRHKWVYKLSCVLLIKI